MEKILTIGTNYVFPVGGGEIKQDRFYLKDIQGTAFAISKDIFMTAGHVLEDLQSSHHPNYFIGAYNESESWRAQEFNKLEVHPKCDVGIFQASIPEVRTAGWCSEEPYLNGDVYSIGFPFAWDSENAQIYFRFFRGYVVAKRPFFKIKPMHPKCYELSFMCPRGLSGAPIFTNNPRDEKKKNAICGMVIGNAGSEIDIYYHKEEIKEGDKQNTTIYHKTETTLFGIGLTSSAIFDLHFDLLGCSVREHLERFNAIQY